MALGSDIKVVIYWGRELSQRDSDMPKDPRCQSEHVVKNGIQYLPSTSNTGCAPLISGLPILLFCLPNVIVQSARRAAKPTTLSALTILFVSAGVGSFVIPSRSQRSLPITSAECGISFTTTTSSTTYTALGNRALAEYRAHFDRNQRLSETANSICGPEEECWGSNGPHREHAPT